MPSGLRPTPLSWRCLCLLSLASLGPVYSYFPRTQGDIKPFSTLMNLPFGDTNFNHPVASYQLSHDIHRLAQHTVLLPPNLLLQPCYLLLFRLTWNYLLISFDAYIPLLWMEYTVWQLSDIWTLSHFSFSDLMLCKLEAFLNFSISEGLWPWRTSQTSLLQRLLQFIWLFLTWIVH